MTQHPLDPDILAFYTEVEDETSRLTRSPHGRLELIRTRALIHRHLQPIAMDVLDVGGGSGVHAAWLAGLGHRVHLVDPVPRHVEVAAGLRGVTAQLGDARQLESAAESFDLALLLGPLYHLADREDRVGSLREAVRVTRRGGTVLAAAIGRCAPPSCTRTSSTRTSSAGGFARVHACRQYLLRLPSP